MGTNSGMKRLVICVYKNLIHGAVLIEGAVQLKLFPDTKIKPFESVQFEGAAQIEQILYVRN